MALLSAQFRNFLQPRNMRVRQEPGMPDGSEVLAPLVDVNVDFDHPEAVQAICENQIKTKTFKLVYTVEISPPAEKSPQVTALPYQPEETTCWARGQQVWSLPSSEVSCQLLTNDLNQVSSVSTLLTSSTSLVNKELFELTLRTLL